MPIFVNLRRLGSQRADHLQAEAKMVHNWRIKNRRIMHLPRHGHRTTGYVPTMFTKWQAGVELLEIAPTQGAFLERLHLYGWPGEGMPLLNPNFVWNGISHLNFQQAAPGLLVNNPLGHYEEMQVRAAHLLDHFDHYSANNLPRELVSVYAVGLLHQHGVAQNQGATLMTLEYFWPVSAGTPAAANAVLYTGRSLGRFLGLLDDANAPSELFTAFF